MLPNFERKLGLFIPGLMANERKPSAGTASASNFDQNDIGEIDGE